MALTEHINKVLANDPDLDFLPMDPDSMDLFPSSSNGLLLKIQVDLWQTYVNRGFRNHFGVMLIILVEEKNIDLPAGNFLINRLKG